MKVELRPQAEDDLNNLYEYLAENTNPDIAFEHVWKLRSACMSLADFPNRGAPRDDVIEGLRILSFERRFVIAYKVERQVTILNIFYGSQNWMRILQEQDGFHEE